MDFYADLRELVSNFDSQGVEYAICGGVALAFFGHARFTKDIDILVPPKQRNTVLAIAEQLGFLDPEGRIPFEHFDIYRTSKIVDRDILILDLLIVNDSLQEVWEDRQTFDWQGLSVHVVSKQGLITMKKMAGRDQDLLDIKKLGGIDAAEN